MFAQSVAAGIAEYIGKEDVCICAVRFQQHYENRIQDMVDDLFRKNYDEPDIVRVLDPTDWDI